MPHVRAQARKRAARPRGLVVNCTLLSFQRPAPLRVVGGNEKASDSRQRPPVCRLQIVSDRARRRSSVEVQGLRCTAPLGRPRDDSNQGRAVKRVAQAASRDEAPLSGLDERIDAACRAAMSSSVTTVAVDLHAALGDQPARLARREPERAGEHGRQMHRIARPAAACSGDVVRRLPFADDAGEMRLGPRRAPPPPCERRDDEARQLELRLHRLARRERLARRRAATTPGAASRGSASCGRTAPRAAQSAGCCCRRTSSSSRRPRRGAAASSARPAARVRSASITSRPASRL